ncbi:hypothetical protein GJAV_G00226840 [Gymnothorax javanicus]|nr:hypothetical protein GJAV_G00226840 [Gymnothorax javanicus]
MRLNNTAAKLLDYRHRLRSLTSYITVELSFTEDKDLAHVRIESADGPGGLGSVSRAPVCAGRGVGTSSLRDSDY